MLLQSMTSSSNRLISTLQMFLHLKAVIRLILFKALCLTLKHLVYCLLKNLNSRLYARLTQKFNLIYQELRNIRSDLEKETLLLRRELLILTPCLILLHFMSFLQTHYFSFVLRTWTI
jgi:hypothetical protein